ncbi:MAG TPA: BMP family ABC transporter substrate-binding protein [Bacilli bacterium]|nr:BMP family ABC transporter substrate-binding protein [Bacilli bacterium]
MKKILSLSLVLLASVGAAGLTSCGAKTYEIALITDVGNIDDKSFNEGAWNGVKNYAEANSISYAYYRPTEDSKAARVTKIGDAVAKGAKIIVCPGYLFEEAIYDVQEEYPDVAFLLLDGEPHNADYTTYHTADNVHNILYREEQAGYLAGYAAVQEGYTKLGFLGGMSVPAVVRYGYGYVQGAEAAAIDMELADGAITMKYNYAGGFGPTDDIKTKMDGWYTAGTEVVFSCGGGIYLSVTAAAQQASAKVIGVDVDQYAESPTIITSAIKGLTSSVEQSLGEFYDNEKAWPVELAGVTSTLGAAEDGVGLATAEGSWRLENYTVAEYETLLADIADGTIVVDNSIAAVPVTAKVTVNYSA